MNRGFDNLIEPLLPHGRVLGIPEGHVGPYVLGNGRMVYWTGRVAIGLRHQPTRRGDEPASRGRWMQAVTLRSRTPAPRLDRG